MIQFGLAKRMPCHSIGEWNEWIGRFGPSDGRVSSISLGKTENVMGKNKTHIHRTQSKEAKPARDNHTHTQVDNTQILPQRRRRRLVTTCMDGWMVECVWLDVIFCYPHPFVENLFDIRYNKISKRQQQQHIRNCNSKATDIHERWRSGEAAQKMQSNYRQLGCNFDWLTEWIRLI